MSTRTRVALLLLFGIGLLCNPFYLWPHHAGDAHELRASETPITADAATAVPVEDLPPETRTAVGSAVATLESAEDLPGGWHHADQGGGHDWPRYESEAAVPMTGLSETGPPTATVEETEYLLTTVTVERSPPVLPEQFRIPVGFAGALALAFGGLLATRGTVQLTTRAAWAVVGVWSGVLLATAAYDGSFAGVSLTTVHEIPLVGIELSTVTGDLLGTAVWVLPAVGFVLGVGFRRERWRSGVGGTGELLSVLALLAVTWPFTLPGGVLGFLIGQDRST
ncbi:uncharacterized protein Nmag_2306 [Natrialba magadii ATCC 43099]|uniref:Uncharacterized protein n=1 Tax=Natrialba magadii (strain ATCC 43099 / DSM 3394 / CCM 3739 / CIP 104546 / IAM 13178 / JCM 8861 / NBRC 102185 / NCIMB 2190 / MS3) TaxID=547559 RepID=D3SWY7_NATMM|nr:hypothetical protein [Natrialba magadii]ADD05869.1 uncharacterized protein Nmag_2306 [Natrialba magadii ATCC 43099]ELY30623.1 hypothetical protein C500_08887 [Natrialba magadii ATCC 43099]